MVARMSMSPPTGNGSGGGAQPTRPLIREFGADGVSDSCSNVGSFTVIPVEEIQMEEVPLDYAPGVFAAIPTEL